MNIPDPADPASNSGQDRPRSCRRFWRWGIGLWIVLWIASILIELGLQVHLKDRPDVMIGAGYGSLVVVLTDQDVHQMHSIEKYGPFFVWSEHNQRTHSEHPEFLYAWLGSVMWKTSGDRHTVALPVSGFLWLWLICGWVVAYYKKSQRPDLRSKRIMVQSAALILLPVVILHASRTMNKMFAENEVSSCMMNMRNIQCAARSYWGMEALNSGDLIPWGEIFGSRKFLPSSIRTCPSGQDYVLDECIPDDYRLLVKCPNPGHQRRLKGIDTSGW